MAELADALDLGSSVYDVQVQVLLSALEATNVENTVFVAFLCNKPLCRNRACTNFYMAANVH